MLANIVNYILHVLMFSEYLVNAGVPQGFILGPLHFPAIHQ